MADNPSRPQLDTTAKIFSTCLPARSLLNPQNILARFSNADYKCIQFTLDGRCWRCLSSDTLKEVAGSGDVEKLTQKRRFTARLPVS
jgi:hypothetical protein